MERLIGDRFDSMHELADALLEYQGGSERSAEFFLSCVPAVPAGLESVRHGRLCIAMVRVPAGEFLMGSNEAEDERPVHRVRIPADFWVGSFPVTQAEYRAVIGQSAREHLRRPGPPPGGFGVMARCRDLLQSVEHRATAMTPYYKIQGERVRIEGGTGYRLLTEAEWEYAARGGGTGRYGVTDDAAELDRFAWYAENSSNQTHEVGLKEPNAFQLHDMLGNVWEWCWDWYSRDGYRGRSDGDRRPRRPCPRRRARAARGLLELGSAIAAVRRQDPVHADRPAALLLRLPGGPLDREPRRSGFSLTRVDHVRHLRKGRFAPATLTQMSRVVIARQLLSVGMGVRTFSKDYLTPIFMAPIHHDRCLPDLPGPTLNMSVERPRACYRCQARCHRRSPNWQRH